jgi:hypothetical protein
VVSGELLVLGILRQRPKTHVNIVFKSTITVVATIQIFVVVSDKFDTYKILAYPNNKFFKQIY